MKSTKIIILCAIALLFAIFSAGCLSFTEELLTKHDEEDHIITDKVNYYFEDDNGRSYNATIWSDDFSEVASTYTKADLNKWKNFVQDLNYIDDPNDGEIFYSPSEVIQQGGGDCEDLAILMARGLYEMGYDTCIFVLDDHVLAGINKTQFDDAFRKYSSVYRDTTKSKTRITTLFINGYYVIETTSKWGIGEYDEPLREVTPKIEKIYYLTHN